MTICLAYAPTEPGRAALLHCAAEAAATGADVVVVNAAREWDGLQPVTLSEDDDRLVGDVLGSADVRWRWHPATDGLSGADEILTVTESADVSLVVIGVTGRSHVEKRIVSDTTKHVMLDAPCPVLAVRADHPLPSAPTGVGRQGS